MTVADLVEEIRSGVVHIEFEIAGKRVASGSGFLSKGLLITNHHVFLGPQESNVTLAVQPSADTCSRVEVTMPYQRFLKAIVTGADEKSHDFAVLDLPKLTPEKHHNFDLEEPQKLRVGDSVLLLGFPFEHRNLACHTGIVSSFYKTDTTQILQLEIGRAHV